MWLLDPSDQKLPSLFFLASSCASSSFLSLRSCSNFQISFCTSYFWSFRSNTQLHILFLCFLASSASWAKQLCFWHSLFISATTSSISVVKVVAVAVAGRTGPPRAAGEGDWPGSRKGIGTKRASLLNVVKNSPSSACLSSSCWSSCTCNPNKTWMWL